MSRQSSGSELTAPFDGVAVLDVEAEGVDGGGSGGDGFGAQGSRGDLSGGRRGADGRPGGEGERGGAADAGAGAGDEDGLISDGGHGSFRGWRGKWKGRQLGGPST